MSSVGRTHYALHATWLDREPQLFVVMTRCTRVSTGDEFCVDEDDVRVDCMECLLMRGSADARKINTTVCVDGVPLERKH